MEDITSKTFVAFISDITLPEYVPLWPLRHPIRCHRGCPPLLPSQHLHQKQRIWIGPNSKSICQGVHKSNSNSDSNSNWESKSESMKSMWSTCTIDRLRRVVLF